MSWRENTQAAAMSAVQSVQSVLRMFEEKTQDFIRDIENVHMVWLEEIQQAANVMFSRDFNSEPELMPKTPSQKKNTRRKRVSVGRLEEGQVRRRLSRGRRSNLRGSAVTKPLDFIVEEAIPNGSGAKSSTSTRPKRTTRTKKQTKVNIAEDEGALPHVSCVSIDECNEKPEVVELESVESNCEVDRTNVQMDVPCHAIKPAIDIPTHSVVVSISTSERLSAEQAAAPQPEPSPGRTAAKIAIAGNGRNSRRSSGRCSFKVRQSLGSKHHSMIRESLRRASRQSMQKKKAARKSNSYNSNVDSASSCESTEEMDEVASEAVIANPEVAMSIGSEESPETTESGQPSLARVTRSVAANSTKLAPPSLFTPERNNLQHRPMVVDTQQTLQARVRSTKTTKREVAETTAESPTKRCTPPKRSRSAVKPSMKSFLHTVQKNQFLMMTPNSFNRNNVIKSFIKHTTPLKPDPKAKELQRLEALKKKQEQEEERMRKMEEEKKKKQEELKRKRDERLRKVYEAKVKEELREEEKKKKIEQKMAHIDEKNDKRQAAEMAKKRIAIKRQEELEQKRKLDEENKRKKNQQAEEEKRHQEFLARKAMEEELKAKKLAEARRALELKREQERERELERERIAAAAAERERIEKAKALALQQELQRAAREKERRDLEEKRKKEEQQRLAAEEKAAKDKELAAKQAAIAKSAAALNVTVELERSVMRTPAAKGSSLNITVDIEKSPQSYSITPIGGNKTLTFSNNGETYGMDQNSDDSTDDESAPRKPIPAWAQGPKLQQLIINQYFNPPDLDFLLGQIEPPKLEDLFYKIKPRYFKRTSSAVWHSPPNVNKH
ncbi:inner centromere protein isoform X2 [Syngnathoides biaculeatus]|uniref:inner centromere protein isoform X2 n=1 Tax=Syngnathoides biaculeatus TaxID=300417 RepID=UPI002ADD8EFE|nr:inner centromere protein isoform X2 [Syngnathoides biaculeatus]